MILHKQKLALSHHIEFEHETFTFLAVGIITDQMIVLNILLSDLGQIIC